MPNHLKLSSTNTNLLNISVHDFGFFLRTVAARWKKPSQLDTGKSKKNQENAELIYKTFTDLEEPPLKNNLLPVIFRNFFLVVFFSVWEVRVPWHTGFFLRYRVRKNSISMKICRY